MALASQPAAAAVLYRFVETSANIPSPIDQTFSVTDAARSYGAVNIDTWCGPGLFSVCRQDADSEGWLSGLLWPSDQALGEMSLVFTGETVAGSIHVLLPSDMELRYQGSGMDWTAEITDAGTPYYSATGYWLDPLPESDALWLLPVGLLGIGWVRRYVYP
jgi:hypothetical protein